MPFVLIVAIIYEFSVAIIYEFVTYLKDIGKSPGLIWGILPKVLVREAVSKLPVAATKEDGGRPNID